MAKVQRELTVVAVLVNLGIGLYRHSGAVRNFRNPAVHGGAHHQVVVLIDAFEFLSDGQPLVARLKGDLGLQRELAPCGGQKRGGQGSLSARPELWLPAFCLS